MAGKGIDKSVVAPLSLIVSGFASVTDIGLTATPQLKTGLDSELLLIDLGRGKNRLAGSALAQVFGKVGDVAPDLDDADDLIAFFEVTQRLLAEERLLAYHDRSDGGLFTTLAEMAFAGHTGVDIVLDNIAGDGPEAVAALFAEEAGAVIQVRAADVQAVRQRYQDAGLGGCVHSVRHRQRQRGRGAPAPGRRGVARTPALGPAAAVVGNQLPDPGAGDNPDCARQEFESIADSNDPGLNVRLTFDMSEDVASPFINTGARPKVAILREQGR